MADEGIVERSGNFQMRNDTFLCCFGLFISFSGFFKAYKTRNRHFQVFFLPKKCNTKKHKLKQAKTLMKTEVFMNPKK